MRAHPNLKIMNPRFPFSDTCFTLEQSGTQNHTILSSRTVKIQRPLLGLANHDNWLSHAAYVLLFYLILLKRNDFTCPAEKKKLHPNGQRVKSNTAPPLKLEAIYIKLSATFSFISGFLHTK